MDSSEIVPPRVIRAMKNDPKTEGSVMAGVAGVAVPVSGRPNATYGMSHFH